MWRIFQIVFLVAALSFNYNANRNPSQISLMCGPPSEADYLNQLGFSFSDTFTVTAYLAIDEYENRFHGITYSGAPARAFHTAAVDPTVVPLGTWLYIENLGWWKAEDTGNMIKGNRLDICLPTRVEAVEWGKKSKKVWVFKPEENDKANSLNTVLLQNKSDVIDG